MILPSAGALTTAITAIIETEIARITCTLSYWRGKEWQLRWLSRDLARTLWFVGFETIT
jgi:hypothetical protein